MRDRGLRACLALLLAVSLSSIGLVAPGAGPLGLDVHEAEAANAIVSTCDFATFSSALASVQSSGGGTLVFDCSGTINFTSTITITSNVTISGQGVVFDGGSPFFNVNAGRTLTLVDLTLQNASRSGTGSINGGAIFNQGTLNVIGVTFDGNQAQSTGDWVQGGAIYSSGPLNVIGSTFTNNTGAGDVVRGAAIASFSTLTVLSSVFDGNTATGDVSGPQTGSLGGAIYMDGSSQRTIEHSTFTNNTTTDPSTAEGGAIFGWGPAPSTISASTFDGNSAAHAGAVYHFGPLSVTNSTFTSNSATSSAGAIAIWGFNSGVQPLTVDASTFSGNSAESFGGAIFGAQLSSSTILGSTFYANTAGTSGSALYRSNAFSVTMSIGGTIVDSSSVTTAAHCGGDPITSLDYNISSDASCNLGGGNDLPSTNPNLGGLTDNGGPTETHLPAGGSPAIDHIPGASCATETTAEDQRGVTRPVNTDCDVGSVEIGGTPPVQIHAVWNDGPILEGDQAQITVDASGPTSPALSYEYDCNGNNIYGEAGDVGPVPGSSAACLFNTAGDFTVNVRVSAGLDQATGSTIVSVLGAGTPLVDPPTFNPPAPNEGTPVTASATFSIGIIGGTLTCTVDYGEGDGPEAATIAGMTCNGPSHTYDDNGTYTVTVEVCAGTECDDASAMLDVGNADPAVSNVSAVPSTINETESTTATANFSDPGVLDTHTCSINWGDGSLPGAGAVNQVNGACTGSHTYADDNPSGTASDNYTITVTITDDDNGSGFNTTTLTVNNLDPSFTSVTNDGPAGEGSPVTITVNGATDPAAPADDPLSYSFDCDNDSVFEVGPQPPNSATCTFPDEGLYTVAALVSDDDLGTATDTTTVTVNNVAPAITALSALPATIDEMGSTTLTVDFTDAGTADSHTCTIDWGDGSLPEAGSVDQNANTCTAAHTYADDNPSGTPGDQYTLTATISDGVDQASDTTDVTVNNLPPVINSITTNAPVPQGQPVNVTVNATDPAGANDPLTYEFDCDNDGSYEIGPQASNTAACALTPGAATTTVGVRVFDDDTGFATGEVTVGQSLMLCVSLYTGDLHGQIPGGGCGSGQFALSLPGAQPLNLCSDRMTGQLKYAGPAACQPAWRTHIVPDGGPVDYCRSLWTGKLRYVLPTANCGAYELRGVIPGV